MAGFNMAEWMAKNAPGAASTAGKVAEGVKSVAGKTSWGRWLNGLIWAYTAYQVAEPLVDKYVTGESEAARNLQAYGVEEQRKGTEQTLDFYRGESRKARKLEVAGNVRDTEMAAIGAEAATASRYGQQADAYDAAPKLSAALATRGETAAQMEYARKLAQGGSMNPLLVMGMNFG